MDLVKFKQKPILGILRGGDVASIGPLIETVVSAGLEAIEITMNTPGAELLIKKARKVSCGSLSIGAGTVLSMESLKIALGSGASFIVTPVLIKEVVGQCVKDKIPVFPGAFTPKEIYQAWEAGATMVKVFPAKFFGPEYFREIKGPFKDIELLACSGVTPENLKDYFACGASAVAFGSSVFKKEALKAGDFKEMGQKIRKYIDAWEDILPVGER